MRFLKSKHISAIAISIVLNLVLVLNIVSYNLHEFREHFHLPSENICNEENEKDACHRYTFHHEKSKACDGTHQHFGERHEICFSCQFFKEKQNDFFQDPVLVLISLKDPDLLFTSTEETFTQSHYRFISLRGPPALIS